MAMAKNSSMYRQRRIPKKTIEPSIEEGLEDWLDDRDEQATLVGGDIRR